MKILVIDGQGGNIGKTLIKLLNERLPQAELYAVGTNSIATAGMIKAGASNAATGENAVAVCARKADIIIGPVGIVIADALMGEITPRMALAVGQSDARKILIPINKCDTLVAGIRERSLAVLAEDAVNMAAALAEEEKDGQK